MWPRRTFDDSLKAQKTAGDICKRVSFKAVERMSRSITVESRETNAWADAGANADLPIKPLTARTSPLKSQA